MQIKPNKNQVDKLTQEDPELIQLQSIANKFDRTTGLWTNETKGSLRKWLGNNAFLNNLCYLTDMYPNKPPLQPEEKTNYIARKIMEISNDLKTAFKKGNISSLTKMIKEIEKLGLYAIEITTGKSNAQLSA